MRIHTGKNRLAKHRFVSLHRDVRPFFIDVHFRQSEVDKVDVSAALSLPNAPIFGFDVPVDYPLGMNLLKDEDHPLCDAKNSFETESTLALVQQGLKVRAQTLHHQGFVV